MSTNYNSTVVANQQLAEAGKFMDLSQNTRFPSVSVVRTRYPDTTQAFPGNTGAQPITSVEIYPKYGIISYIANTDEFAVTLSAGQVYLDTAQIEAHLSNIDPATQAIELNTYDTLTAIAAFNNNYLSTVSALSAKVTVINPVTAVTILNPVTALSSTILNPVTAVTVVNSVTAMTVLNPVTAVTLLNPVTGFTVLNPISSFNIASTSLTLPISGNVTITNTVSTTPVGTQLVTYVDSVQMDQTNRLRVVTPQTQWWYMATVDKDGDIRYNESFVGGASSIYVQNIASVNMTSGTTSVSGLAIRASRRRRHKIIPGISHEYTGVWNWDGQQANVVKRIGIFTQFNGYFFELSGTNSMNVVVRRRLVNGTLVEERVNQNQWNGDKLDGTGPSGENWNDITQTATITGWNSTTPVTINSTLSSSVWNVVYGLSAGQVQNFRQGTKASITGITPSTYNAVAMITNTDSTTNRLTASYLFNPGVSASNATAGSMIQNGYHMQHTYWIDFMGGRTNRIRFGKLSDNGKIILNTFAFDGLLGTSYENAPTLTERKEIYNIGTPTTLPSFTVMGNSFNVEAAVDVLPNFNVARNDTGIAFNTADEFPILGLAIRTGEPYQRADIQLNSIIITDIANIDNNNNKGCFSWRVVLNPSIQGTIPASTNIGKASRQWAYTTGNSVSGGIDLIGGYGVSTLTENFPTALNFINMGSNIDNTDSDKIVVVAKLLNKGTDNSNLVTTMNFVETL